MSQILTVNSTADILDAFSDETLNGKQLRIQPGEYELPERLVLYADDVDIRGAGTDQTILRLAGGVNAPLLSIPGRQNVTIQGVTLDHAGGTDPDATNTTGNCVTVSADAAGVGASNVTFRSCILRHGAASNIRIQQGATNVTLDNCLSLDADQARNGAVNATVTAGTPTDTHCHFVNSTFYHTERAHHSDDTAWGGQPVGFETNANRNRLTNCYIEGGAARGLLLASDSNHVTNAYFFDTGGAFFEINGGENNAIIGGAGYRAKDNGFSVFNGATENLITGFTVDHVNYHGGVITGGVNAQNEGQPASTRNLIANCTFRNCSQAQYNGYPAFRFRGDVAENVLSECTIDATGASHGIEFRTEGNTHVRNRISAEIQNAVRNGVFINDSGSGTNHGTTLSGTVRDNGQGGYTKSYGVDIVGASDVTIHHLTATNTPTTASEQTQTHGVHTAGSDVSVDVLDSDLRGNATAATDFGSLNHPRVIRNVAGYTTRAAGTASVADGGTIPHGLDVIPTAVSLTPTDSGRRVAATEVSDKTITVSLTDDGGNAISTEQEIYWNASRFV